jgi:hypothetical protein
MAASISAVGLRLRAHPRDPILTVLRQVEAMEERQDFPELAMRLAVRIQPNTAAARTNLATRIIRVVGEI